MNKKTIESHRSIIKPRKEIYKEKKDGEVAQIANTGP
jgi:hypothetical protein